MNELTKKEKRANIIASLSSLVLIIFSSLQNKFEFSHEMPFLIVLLICITCMIASIWAAYCLISNNKMIKASLFQVSATSCLATLLVVFSFKKI